MQVTALHAAADAQSVHLASLREPRLEEFPVGGGSNKLKVRLRIRNLAALPLMALMAMCGRPRFGKGCFDVNASWSGAVMCPACLRDTIIAGPNAIRGSGPD